jgi:hypothetical protein
MPSPPIVHSAESIACAKNCTRRCPPAGTNGTSDRIASLHWRR